MSLNSTGGRFQGPVGFWPETSVPPVPPSPLPRPLHAAAHEMAAGFPQQELRGSKRGKSLFCGVTRKCHPSAGRISFVRGKSLALAHFKRERFTQRHGVQEVATAGGI